MERKLEKAKNKLGGSRSSYYSSAYSSTRTFSSYSSRASAHGTTNKTVTYRGKTFEVYFKGGKPKHLVEDIECPKEVVSGEIAGIDKTKSQGHECAMNCVNNCSNVLEACYHSSSCTTIMFAELTIYSATKQFGGATRSSTGYGFRNYSWPSKVNSSRYTRFGRRLFESPNEVAMHLIGLIHSTSFGLVTSLV